MNRKGQSKHIRKLLGVAGFLCGWVFFSFTLGLLNFVFSFAIDLSIAEKLGGVRDIPQDGTIFGGGKSFGGIEWTFSSVLGPFLTLPIPFGIIIGILITGLFFWLILWNTFRQSKRPFGKYNWLILANIAVWLLRFPVPIEYSLFYWTAIKF